MQPPVSVHDTLPEDAPIPARDPAGPRTHAQASRQRRDAVSGAVMPEAKLVRFVADPAGVVVPDVARRLPGRGVWVEATRATVDAAVKRGAFSRSAKARLIAPPDLADQVDRLLARRVLDRLGLARRAGELTFGFEKAAAAISSGRAAWMVEAMDGAADGRRKIFQIARRVHPRPRLLGAFTAAEISLALGLGNVIHGVCLAGRGAEGLTEDVERLSGFRPLFPDSWSDGRAGEGAL